VEGRGTAVALGGRYGYLVLPEWRERQGEEIAVYDYIKALLLAIYLLAAIGGFLMLPEGLTAGLQVAALVLLAAHALELIAAFASVKRYPGPMIDSIALTLLFGFLHWKPLGRDA
jgi:uncharacterized protein YhhL (DUF1145 family)